MNLNNVKSEDLCGSLSFRQMVQIIILAIYYSKEIHQGLMCDFFEFADLLTNQGWYKYTYYNECDLRDYFFVGLPRCWLYTCTLHSQFLSFARRLFLLFHLLESIMSVRSVLFQESNNSVMA